VLQFGILVLSGKQSDSSRGGLMRLVKVPKRFREACEMTVESLQGDLKYCKPSSWKAGQKQATQDFIDAVNNPIKIGRAVHYRFLTDESFQIFKDECDWHLEYETDGEAGFVDVADASLIRAIHNIQVQEED